MILGPWKLYNPGVDVGVLFLETQGIDWYKYRDQIKSKYLLVFAENGGIIAAYDDISHAFPGDLYTAEIDELPADFHRDKYRFGPEGLTPFVLTPEERLAKNRRIQESGLKRFAEEINTLVMLKNVEAISEEESGRLDRLTDFVKRLKKIDLTNPDWPDLPS